MAYTRTGRPPGRPKTKQYVTVMARISQELADRLQRYAALHQQSVSVVLRDGLELLLEGERYTPLVSDRNTATENVSDTNASTESARQEIVSDTNDVPQTPQAVPAYNPATQYLGTLCPNEHAYEGTGQSVLQKSNGKCVQCHNAQARQRRQAKRQAQPE